MQTRLMSAADTIAAIRGQAGIAVIPHTFAHRPVGPLGLESVGDEIEEPDFNALETVNSSPYIGWANRVATKDQTAGAGATAYWLLRRLRAL